jgi:hypothetical protein
VILHDDDLAGLREEIVRYLGKTARYWPGRQGGAW